MALEEFFLARHNACLGSQSLSTEFGLSCLLRELAMYLSAVIITREKIQAGLTFYPAYLVNPCTKNQAKHFTFTSLA